MKKIFIILPIIGLLVMGCKKSLLDLKNENQYSDATYFKNAAQLEEAMTATYSVLLHNGLYARDYYFILDLLGNDAERDAPLLGDLLQLHNYSFGASNTPITDLWTSLYRMIYRSNLVIAKATEWNPALDSEKELRKRFIGQAKFLKSLAEFNLVALWGKVPLKVNYDASKELQTPRSSVEDIWKDIETNLTEAQVDLPLSYSPNELGKATKGAAVALLGKAYLYQKKYALAASTLDALTKSPYSYSLNPSYFNQFTEANNTSTETIFDVQHKWTDWSVGNQYYMFGGQEAWGGKATHSGRAQEYGWNDWRNVLISDAAVKAFKYKDEENVDYIDPRAALTFYGDAPSGGSTTYCSNCTGGALPYPYNASNGYRWRKYENYEFEPQSGGPHSNINSQIIRYADVLLMLAEAKINSNDLSGALPLINMVRERVGAFEYTSLGNNTADAMKILMRERQVEFAGEQLRWFDLVRWGIAKQTINAEKQIQIGAQPFQDKNVLLPIPQSEKNTNLVVAADVQNDWN